MAAIYCYLTIHLMTISISLLFKCNQEPELKKNTNQLQFKANANCIYRKIFKYKCRILSGNTKNYFLRCALIVFYTHFKKTFFNGYKQCKDKISM